jgi:hypothetical protein
MKNFFKHITNDPYIDWLVIFSLGVVGVIGVTIWSFVTYKEIETVDIVSITATSTQAAGVDVKKLDKIITIFDAKKEVHNMSSFPNIDVRDPSL